MSHQGAVRAAMREVLVRLATARGLTAPIGALASGPVEDDELARMRALLAPFDGDEVEQLGYAYETLLEHEDRKHAGAHYTPMALADEVVAHALAPVVRDLPADKLLDLNILDLAAGSGVFLVSAARYLAALPGAPALRDIVTSCLYGADVNATTVEICTLSLWLLAEDPDLPWDLLHDKVRCGDSLVEVEGVGDRTPVSWAEAAPEVMAAGGFDAVIGNPPFLGVKNIRGAVGQRARDHYARTLLDGESGRSDLVVFFLAQAARLSRNVVGLVVPDAIAEGDSARFGPARVLEDGYRLYRAETSRPWPSEAGVRIALVWFQRTGLGDDEPVLDGVEVPWIGPHLGRETAAVAGRREPPPWMPHGYQATIVLGKALVLTPARADALIASDPRAGQWVRDYLSGEDLVSQPGSTATRRVLDFGRADLRELEAVPALEEVLRSVKAERDAQHAKYPQLASRWWTFLNPVDRLYDALAEEPEAIAFSKHAKFIWPVLVPTGPVFSNGVIVYPSSDRGIYAFLASTPHRLWAVDEGGSRLNQSHRYNPSRLLATYPFPDSFGGARDAGEQLASSVADALAQLGVGVTELLNQVNADAPTTPVVESIRSAMIEVDRAVLAAHGIGESFAYAVRHDADRTRFAPSRADEARIKTLLLARR